ncbi:MAG: type IV secretion protein IcmD [Gammaproteobacteria bacterium]|nr:type IV secretion protein IcmD [Gammaproteobacteria bacterium]
MKEQVVASKYGFVLKVLSLLIVAIGCFYAGHALAATGSNQTIGDIAQNITSSFKEIGKLMFATAYLAGFGFVIAAIFKFKQHKDNPTQIPMGTPIAMLVIGVALIFLPSIIGPAGSTIFKDQGVAGGFSGQGISIIPGS